MRFAEHAPFLQPAAPGSAANPRDSWPSWTDRPLAIGLGPVVPGPAELAPRWRSLAVTMRDEEVDRVDGYGRTALEDLIRLAVEAHGSDLAGALAAGEGLADFVATSGDQAIWDGASVVAILRVLADGSLEVARFAAAGTLVGSCSAVEGGGR